MRVIKIARFSRELNVVKIHGKRTLTKKKIELKFLLVNFPHTE